MSKSVLIINTPSACCECLACKKDELEHIKDFIYRQNYTCVIKVKWLSSEQVLNKRPSWCPLRDL